MSYVPIVPQEPQHRASPLARRLAVEIEDGIERFEAEQGRPDPVEVGQALEIVKLSRGTTSGRETAVASGIVLAMLLGLAVLALTMKSGGAREPALDGDPPRSGHPRHRSLGGREGDSAAPSYQSRSLQLVLGSRLARKRRTQSA